ncbi:MAG: D-alanyl-D-alanine carboxypeptidase/D-alanyl-D-alanine-endopeptidase [Acidimicrobiales bacterium]
MRRSSPRHPTLVTILALVAGAVAVTGLVDAARWTRPAVPIAAPVVPPASVPPPTSQPTTSSSTTAPPPDPAARNLSSRLDAVLANTNSCLVVSDAGGVVYRHGTAPLTPASTQKLIVAAAALDVLGPSFRYVTSVVAARPPVGGVVDELWLVGGGDPVLASPGYIDHLESQPMTAGVIPTTQLIALAAQLEAAGVHRVAGTIHGDDSRHERLRSLPGWKQIYFDEADIAPLSALEVDDGLDSWAPERVAADPAAHAADVFSRLVGGRRIAAAPGPDSTAPPGGVVLASIQSPPLADLVSAMIRSSNNLTAELVLRELDRARGGTGTSAGGAAVVAAEAAKLGLPVTGLRLVDGSGLSPADQATCDVLLGARALSDRPEFAPIGAGLSIAGRNGTLVNRFIGTPAAGHLVAKTGSIAGVSGLVGKLDGRRPLRFALLANGDFGYLAGAGLEDRVVAALGTYPEP